jgi:hypothetical protein
MNDGKTARQMFTQGSSRAVETMTLWADAHQRVLRELAELSAATAKEGVRLYAELQQGALETLREAQASTLEWQSAWPDTARDPMAWCQRALIHGAESAQTCVRLLEGNAHAATRTAERWHATAEQAGKGIQASLSEAMTRTRELSGA